MPRKGRYIRKSDQPGYVETRGKSSNGGAPKLTASSPLTRAQERFVMEIVSKDGQITKREAAVNAGFAVAGAHVTASNLTDPSKHPNVVAKIAAYQEELDIKYGVTYQRHMRDLQLIRDQALANGSYAAAAQAEYRRGMAHGDIYVSKSEIRHGSIDSMSKEEVLRALEEIQNNGPVTIDITPETLTEDPAEVEDNAEGSQEKREQFLGDDKGGHSEDGPELEDDED